MAPSSTPPDPLASVFLLGRAERFEASARRLRTAAAEFPEAFRREIAARSGRDVWVGPAADRFHGEFVGHCRRLADLAAVLIELAGDLDREAERLRREARPVGVFGGSP